MMQLSVLHNGKVDVVQPVFSCLQLFVIIDISQGVDFQFP